MNRLMISVVVAVVLIGTAATVLRSHAPSSGPTVGMVSSKAPKPPASTPASGKKLPIEEYEDMSLVYSRKDRSAQ